MRHNLALHHFVGQLPRGPVTDRSSALLRIFAGDRYDGGELFGGEGRRRARSRTVREALLKGPLERPFDLVLSLLFQPKGGLQVLEIASDRGPAVAPFGDRHAGHAHPSSNPFVASGGIGGGEHDPSALDEGVATGRATANAFQPATMTVREVDLRR
jgi:hypothetical protein